MSTSPTPSERTRQDEEARAKEAAEQALLPYKWTQTIQDLDITVPIPANLRSRDLIVTITKDHLTVGIKGQDPIIDGPLPHPIHPSESTWTLTTASTPTKDLSLHLDKRNKMEWWSAITTNAAYHIDTAKIVPENSKLGDLDGETRGMVEKMMFDQRQRETGGKTSEERGKEEMLEKFKAQHPEMDFGGVKMG